MAFGKSSRMDKKSSFCSTATVVVFVALCLVGIWMMTSSTVAPVDISPSEDNTNTEMKQQIPIDEPSRSEDSIVVENNTQETEKVKENTEEDNPPASEGKKNDPQETNQTSEESNETKENSNENQAGVETNNEENNSEQEKTEDNVTQDEKLEEKTDENQGNENETKSEETKTKEEVFPDGAQSEILKEADTSIGAWKTQAAESKNEKEVQKTSSNVVEYDWKLCNVTAGADFIPCLDNVAAIKKLHSTKHYEHRERHCPEESPTCLVSLPDGYQRPIQWPDSRDKIWYHNVPHTKLAVVKGHQNWVKVTGEYLTFPGGGTQFKNGALHYIDKIQEALPKIAWGKRTRVILDVGCGVASFGGYLFERDVLAMSFAPKDEHEAQVQFALERGIPAISAVMGTQRLPFPGRVYDAIHCARCRVPWHIEGGKLLLELNRLLRPGGYFVWSATPVYQDLPEDVEIWKGF